MSLPRLAALAALALGTTACADILGIPERYLVDGGDGGTPGVCEGTIRARLFYDMTGPTQDVSSNAARGQHAYLRALNDEGGIRGCPIQIDSLDTKYDQATTLHGYDAWKAQAEWPEVSVLFGQGTPMTETLAPLAAADEKLVIINSYAGEFGAPVATTHTVQVPSVNDNFAEATVAVSKKSAGYPYVFFPGTDYSTAARVAVDAAWSAGARRVGFFQCSTSAFCTDPVDAAKTFLKQLPGTEIGRALDIELDDTEAAISTKVLAYFQAELAQKAKDPSYAVVDWVWFGNNRATTTGVAKALAQVKAQLGLTVSVTSNMWGVDEELFSECGAPCVGFNVVETVPLFGDLGASGMANVMAVHEKYNQLDGLPALKDANLLYVNGYLAVAMWKIAVEQVVDAGQKVTGKNVRAALETFRAQDVEGFGTLTFTAGDHRPQSTARMYTLDDGGRLKASGQPLSIALQEAWLGW